MERINFKPSRLQILYLFIFLLLFFFIIYTPTLISGPVHLTKKMILEEETIEGTLLFILFLLSFWIFNLYKRDVYKHKVMIEKINHDKKKVEERLHDSDLYIGMVNVQIQEINSTFNNISKYPETKADLKKTFRYFGNRVIGIANTDWVLFRIINSNNQRTLCEHFETRQGSSHDYPCVSNKMIIEKQPVSPFTSIISDPQNFDIIVFSILPADQITNEQRIFIQAIINEITKMFIILNSSYYRKGSEIFAGQGTENKITATGTVLAKPGKK
jgi:hypothetical protein